MFTDAVILFSALTFYKAFMFPWKKYLLLGNKTRSVIYVLALIYLFYLKHKICIQLFQHRKSDSRPLCEDIRHRHCIFRYLFCRKLFLVCYCINMFYFKNMFQVLTLQVQIFWIHLPKYDCTSYFRNTLLYLLS